MTSKKSDMLTIISLKARGLNQESINKGIEVGTMMGLTNWVKESKTTLSF